MSKPSQTYDKPPFTVCIVEYTCPTCCRRWHSANGNLDDYQICKNCYEKCYPGTYKYQAPNKKGNQNPETYIPHNTELCGKCIRLGHSCMEELGLEKPDRVISNLEGESVTLDNSQDFSSYFTLATAVKTKPEKKKPAVSKKMQQLRDKQAWSALLDAGKEKPVVKENDESKEQIVSNVVNKDEALYDNKSEDEEETPASDKENVAPKVSDNNETVADTNYGDEVDNGNEDIGAENIDADSTDNNITDNESSGDEEKSTSDNGAPNTEGTTTPIEAKEDSRSTCSNETTEDFTLENLSIADIKSNDKLKEEYGDKDQ